MSQDTTSRLLDAAQHLVQQRGYNAFAYKDLATAVGIRTASIHYHFPTKADLGQALIQRYQARFDATLEDIDGRCQTATAKLKRFVGLFRDLESGHDICLCGSLAADQGTLPEPMQASITEHFTSTAKWVAERIAEGVAAGEFEFDGRPADAATALVAALQGALIVHRGRGGQGAIVDAVRREFLRSLGAR